jgi:RNA polymerase sigma-70 factor (ECF subfamily)
MIRPPAWWRRRTQRAPGARTIDKLAEALGRADADGIRHVLHPDVVTLVDGGGHVDAPLLAEHGIETALTALSDAVHGGTAERASINGSPGIVVRDRDRVIATVCAGARGEKLVELWIIRNPEKLQRWNRG